MIYFVTLETEKGVKASVSYNAGQTTNEEELESKFTHEFLKDTATQRLVTLEKDISFKACGMLNTELVAYMNQLNDLVIDLLNGCESIAEMEKMLQDLSVVFSTENEFSLNNLPDCNTALKNALTDSEGLIRGDYALLFYRLTNITNYGTMDELQGYVTAILEIPDEYRPAFYSPFGIYYLWMKAYEYLPTNMQTK